MNRKAWGRLVMAKESGIVNWLDLAFEITCLQRCKDSVSSQFEANGLGIGMRQTGFSADFCLKNVVLMHNKLEGSIAILNQKVADEKFTFLPLTYFLGKTSHLKSHNWQL